ncbi:Oligopeptide transport ATP-binding protein OppF [Rhodobacteraceae bacterium THAF1]|uniref:oligopeptide/dipeptide ABC transporter ATP-binding protein n=1 Tax=Palleronia sp. THAF1 TaxID=2587842 RepID=UPI000F3B24E2|nr:oligopeptide/dipeptide ABC transporter ATP-binding protein [Palleronia sp. THAF1]QFU07436.1 Oligopeptide transport ATP-binding protein OppF [Palleronia sp. THAF1]VDC20652.1 Oligopeptide transport ATP-binding protein OppF [Rhodobacteraceae bacterium THAF1]
MSPLLSVRDLRVTFPITRAGDMPWTKPRELRAVNGVDFDLEAGETLGVVGESGCGKSTLARGLIQMVPATGTVMWRGETDLLSLSRRAMLPFRSEIQMVFQDPLASLNPRMTLGQIIAEPLRTHRADLDAQERRKRVAAMMERVGLLPQMINRYPHEFSGGQCQRIGIARALVMEPKLLICDEPVSALDVSIQAQVIDLLRELQRDLGLAMIFIAHDLSVVKHISDQVMVLYLGRVMEKATKRDLYADPQHPYTQALMSAVPIPDPVAERAKKIIALDGDLPSPMNPPSGCVFRTRCPRAQADCADVVPETGDGAHRVACLYPGPAKQAEMV